MKANLTFLKNLKIPYTEWTEEIVDDSPCLVLRNEEYCRVFWTAYWRQVALYDFRKQSVYTDLQKVNLDSTVMIDMNTGEFKMPPKSLESVNYFSNHSNDSYFSDNILFVKVDMVHILIAIIVILFSLVFVIFKVYNRESIWNVVRFL